MKKYKKIFGIAFLGAVFLLGCVLLWWNLHQSDMGYEEEKKVSLSSVKKENIIDAFVQQNNTAAVTQDDLKKTLLIFDEKGLFADDTNIAGLSNKTYEEKITLVGECIIQMMHDIARVHIVGVQDALTDDNVPIVDIETGVKKYFFAVDSTERYEKYLADRFNIGIYPTPEELSGEWHGEITISHVVVFKEIAGSPNLDPAIFYALKGKKYPFDFVINCGALADDEGEKDEALLKKEHIAIEAVPFATPNGKITPHTVNDAQKFPFAYRFFPHFTEKTTDIPIHYSDIKESGHLTARFGDAQKAIEGIIDARAKNGENNHKEIDGDIHFSFHNRYLKISGTMHATQK